MRTYKKRRKGLIKRGSGGNLRSFSMRATRRSFFVNRQNFQCQSENIKYQENRKKKILKKTFSSREFRTYWRKLIKQ